MRVLYITNNVELFGANKSLIALIKILREEYGVQPTILMPCAENNRLAKYCDKNGIEYYCHAFRPNCIVRNLNSLPLRKIIKRSMRMIDFCEVYRSLNLKDGKFDLVHSNTSAVDIGYYLSKWMKVPHIWHVRENIYEHYGMEYIYSKNRMGKMLESSASVITISDVMLEYLRGFSKSMNVERIYNGIQLCKPYKKIYNSKPCFCIVGRISKSKNQLDVVKAAQKLISMGYVDFRVNVVGNIDGDDCTDIMKEIDKNPKLKQIIAIVPYQQDIDTYLKNQDVGIMTSDYEAFGRTTVEYMANYMMVIGARTGGTPEVIGDAGMIFELHNIDELADCMKQIIINPDILSQQAESVRARAQLFTASKNASEIFEVYKKHSLS